MNHKWNGTKPQGEQLRVIAEARLACAPAADAPACSAAETLHELQVYRIELEMQNETLRQTQEALEKSRDRYVDMYEFAPVAYLTLTRSGMIAEANLTGAALLGMEREKLLNRRFARFVAPEDGERWHRYFMYTLRHGGKQSCELAFQHADGTVFHGHLDGLYLEAGDTPTEVRIALTDLSERKRAEEELRIAAIAFESQAGMMVTDPHGVILRVNQAFTRLTGYSAEEAAGKTPALLKSGRHEKAFYERMWINLKEKGRWQGEIWNRRKNGDIYAEWLSVTAVADAYGCITHYVGTFSDITRNNETESHHLI